MKHYYRRESVFIPYNVPSVNNAKKISFIRNKDGQIVFNAKGEPKTILIRSEMTSRYIKRTDNYFKILRNEFLRIIKDKPSPIKVQFTFYREKEDKWDFNNLTQTVQNQMVKHRWIIDDDKRNLLVYPPIHFPYYKVDDFNPGVLITVL